MVAAASKSRSRHTPSQTRARAGATLAAGRRMVASGLGELAPQPPRTDRSKTDTRERPGRRRPVLYSPRGPATPGPPPAAGEVDGDLRAGRRPLSRPRPRPRD